jgi:hypothetical protein
MHWQPPTEFYKLTEYDGVRMICSLKMKDDKLQLALDERILKN